MKLRSRTLLFLASSSLMFARLGETEKELVARFGEAQMRSKHSVMAHGKILEIGPTLHFKQEDWTIISDLADGRVVRENYRKTGEWTPEQIQAVLAANAQGASWTETTKANGKLQRTWKRTDGATAEWVVSGGIRLVTPAYDLARSKVEAGAKAGASRVPKI